MKKILLLTLVSLASFSIMGQSYTGRISKPRTEQLNDEYCSGLFKSAYGTILDLVDDNTSVQGYFNILDWMQGRVAGLQIFMTRKGTPIPFIRGSTATVYVDEIPVDAGFLNALSVNDVALIKVIKGPFAGGIGSNSAVAIYTLKPEEAEDQ